MGERVIYTIPISGETLTGEEDIFHLLVEAGYKIEILEIVLGQVTVVGDAAAEMMALEWRRDAAEGGDGAAVVPIDVRQNSRVSTTVATVIGTLSEDGELLRGEAINLAAPFIWRPTRHEHWWFNAGQIFTLAAPTALSGPVALSGTLTFAEEDV